jgi:hypothetical protein
MVGLHNGEAVCKGLVMRRKITKCLNFVTIFVITVTALTFLRSFSIGYGPIARRFWMAQFDRGHLIVNNTAEGPDRGWYFAHHPPGEALSFIRESENIPEGQVGYTRYSIWPGFLYQSDPLTMNLSLPMWLVAVVMGAIVGRIYLYRRKQDRTRNALCPNCAYDLRAHTAGDKCPECGTPVSTPPAMVRRTKDTPSPLPPR